MTTEPPSDPVILRKEIAAILDKVTNRGSLLFFHWLIVHIDKKMPPPQELKRLHQVFIRVADGFQNKKKIAAEDWRMLFRYVGVIGNGPDISRHLASTVKLYREKAGLTRLQLSKKLGIKLRTVLALERGGVKDMSLPRLWQLASALGVDAGAFMDRIYKLERANDRTAS
jgi:DNA-binding XRE family transcriptional regulator